MINSERHHIMFSVTVIYAVPKVQRDVFGNELFSTATSQAEHKIDGTFETKAEARQVAQQWVYKHLNKHVWGQPGSKPSYWYNVKFDEADNGFVPEPHNVTGLFDFSSGRTSRVVPGADKLIVYETKNKKYIGQIKITGQKDEMEIFFTTRRENAVVLVRDFVLLLNDWLGPTAPYVFLPVLER